MANYAIHPDRANVRCAYSISMRNETASRTAKNASLGFMPFATAWAGLAGVSFIDQCDRNSGSPCLVFDVRSCFAVGPVGYFLIILLTQVDSICYIAHGSDGECANLAFNSPIHDRPGNLMFDVPLAPFLLSQEAVLALLQPQPAL